MYLELIGVDGSSANAELDGMVIAAREVVGPIDRAFGPPPTARPIPDNNTGGLVLSISVSGVPAGAPMRFNSNVSHPDADELTITLTGPGGASKVLWNRAPGSDPYMGDIDVSAIAGGRNGTWTLKIVDAEAGDVGNLEASYLLGTY